jgi:hypothetical protein
MLERMIQHIKRLDGVWITQMGAIADDFRQRKATQPSTSASM